jgi:hypothetical protein
VDGFGKNFEARESASSLKKPEVWSGASRCTGEPGASSDRWSLSHDGKQETERDMTTEVTQTGVLDLIRTALDSLVVRGSEDRDLMAHEERAAIRLRQALELLEGTGTGGFEIP